MSSSQPETKPKHLWIVGLRLLGMIGVAFAGLIGFQLFADQPNEKVEQAPGVVGLIFAVSVGCAMIYGSIASLTHFLLRRKPTRTLLTIEVILGLTFILFMAYNGANFKTSRSTTTAEQTP